MEESEQSNPISFERTGEWRCPRAGEWFIDYRGVPIQARFNFTFQVYQIVIVNNESISS